MTDTSRKSALATYAIGALIGGLVAALAAFAFVEQRLSGLQGALALRGAELELHSTELNRLSRALEKLQSDETSAALSSSQKSAQESASPEAKNVSDALLDESFINQVADKLAQPNRSRFPEPSYEKSMQRLADAGFSAFDAEKIFAIEAEAHLRFIDAMSNPATRGSASAREIIFTLGSEMRAYLGDYGYENYLKSRDIPVAVKVRSVIKNSAGSAAGMQANDEIVRYAGERVFDIYSLNKLTAAGTKGESVAVEVMRNGSIEIIRLPRGEIGISGRPLSPRSFFQLNEL